jgi:hypothetical protein
MGHVQWLLSSTVLALSPFARNNNPLKPAQENRGLIVSARDNLMDWISFSGFWFVLPDCWSVTSSYVDIPALILHDLAPQLSKVSLVIFTEIEIAILKFI